MAKKRKAARKVGATLLMEKKESRNTKPKKVVRIFRNKKGEFKGSKSIGAIPGFVNQSSVTQLVNFIKTNPKFYLSNRRPLLMDLQRRHQAGRLNFETAYNNFLSLVSKSQSAFSKANPKFRPRIELSAEDKRLTAMKLAREAQEFFAKGGTI